MQMHHVHYFLALCEEKNFGRAARRCRIAQPSLTKAIKKLEAEFGRYFFTEPRESNSRSSDAHCSRISDEFFVMWKERGRKQRA
jgi:Bacterial regulatory helix-turn-helix protein, lysR family